MPKKDDLVGMKFGRWEVIEDSGLRDNQGRVRWRCKCECGSTKLLLGFNLKNGHSRSCGCYRDELHTTHGDTTARQMTSLYAIWSTMRARCSYPRHNRYHRYGGRGIKVCHEWKRSYPSFKKWAIEHGYRKGLSIDRINHNGNYEPENCQWLTVSENVKKAYSDRKGV